MSGNFLPKCTGKILLGKLSVAYFQSGATSVFSRLLQDLYGVSVGFSAC